LCLYVSSFSTHTSFHFLSFFHCLWNIWSFIVLLFLGICFLLYDLFWFLLYCCSTYNNNYSLVQTFFYCCSQFSPSGSNRSQWINPRSVLGIILPLKIFRWLQTHPSGIDQRLMCPFNPVGFDTINRVYQRYYYDRNGLEILFYPFSYLYSLQHRWVSFLKRKSNIRI
jgi:hypothetical protein